MSVRGIVIAEVVYSGCCMNISSHLCLYAYNAILSNFILVRDTDLFSFREESSEPDSPANMGCMTPEQCSVSQQPQVLHKC